MAFSTLTVVKEVDPGTAKGHKKYQEKDERVCLNCTLVNISEMNACVHRERSRESCVAVGAVRVHR